MEQDERLDYLVKELLEESPYKGMKVEREDRARILRSLMNIRMPRQIAPQFLSIQNSYLKEECKKKGIVSVHSIPTIKEQYNSKSDLGDRISIWQGDITRLEIEAIVNAANSQMLGCFVPCHGCIDNAIHSAAGIELREECADIMRLQGQEEVTGKAKITGAYNLPCKFVIHTVGPVVGEKVSKKDCELLKSCYESCLELAEEKKLESLAFCCISTGEFHFPNDKAAEIAVDTVERFLKHSNIKRIIFNVFKDDDLFIYEDMINRI